MRNFVKLVFNIFLALSKVLLKLAVILALLYLYYFVMDYAFKDVLTHTSRSVLSNFIIFSAVIVFVLFKVANFSNLLESKRTEVVKVIENSKLEKEKSLEELSKIEESMANLDSDIQSILDHSSANANLVGEKLIEQAEKSAIMIKNNANKAYENSCLNLKNEISQKALKASVEVAKNHILKELESNPNLHNKLIDDSLNAINEVTL